MPLLLLFCQLPGPLVSLQQVALGPHESRLHLLRALRFLIHPWVLQAGVTDSNVQN